MFLNFLKIIIINKLVQDESEGNKQKRFYILNAWWSTGCAPSTGDAQKRAAAVLSSQSHSVPIFG